MTFVHIDGILRSTPGIWESTRKQKCLLISVLFLSIYSVVSEASDYSSPIALTLSSEGSILYVAELTGESVAIIDTTTGQLTKRIPIGSRVNGLTLSADNKTLYVTAGQENGRLISINTTDGKILQNLSTGHTPTSPKITTDGRLLLVCNRYKNTVSIFRLDSNMNEVSIAVPREPIAAAITPDNRLAVVANHLQAGRSDVNHIAAVVSLIDLTTQRKLMDIGLPNGSGGLRDVCISPDGRYAYVTHLLARFQLPTTQVDRGWMNTNAFSIIDLQNRKWLTTVLLDEMDLGAANPWGIACSADGRLICVCHSGTHEVSMINRIALHKKITESTDLMKIANDFSFLNGLRLRIPLSGKGPRSVVLYENKAYVGLYFSDVVDVIDLSRTEDVIAATLSLGSKQTTSDIRRGEMIFNDGEKCFQKWQSCASCHPDGSMDAMNWDLLNDGVGNHKNVKSLLLSYVTPPVMSSGVRADAETAVRAGMHHIQFLEFDGNDVDTIDAYLKSMKPIPSPYLVDGQLSESARRGAKLFESAGCVRCHSGPYLTDMKSHAVGTGRGKEADLKWDTPTLINVWKTAPYMHDGRAVTIQEVLTTENPHDNRGKTSTLTGQQIYDLAEFVLSQ